MSKPKNENLIASVEIVVPFHDVDIMHVVWHGHYAKYFEIARCKLLPQIHCDHESMRELGYVWPIVKAQQKFIEGARFDQILTVTAEAVEWDVMLVINYKVMDASTGKVLVKGQTTQAAVNMKTGETCFQTPDFFRERLGV